MRASPEFRPTVVSRSTGTPRNRVPILPLERDNSHEFTFVITRIKTFSTRSCHSLKPLTL